MRYKCQCNNRFPNEVDVSDYRKSHGLQQRVKPMPYIEGTDMKNVTPFKRENQRTNL